MRDGEAAADRIPGRLPLHSATVLNIAAGFDGEPPRQTVQQRGAAAVDVGGEEGLRRRTRTRLCVLVVEVDS